MLLYTQKLVSDLGQLDKLIERVLKLDKNLRFDELAKLLNRMGYVMRHPRGGSSHYTFSKHGKPPITIPKDNPINKVYIEMCRNAILMFESEAQKDD